jgi:hypothetical protein
MTLSEAEASGLGDWEERSRDRSELSIKSSNETALLLQSVMTTVQRLVDNNHSCRLEKVGARPLLSPTRRRCCCRAS